MKRFLLTVIACLLCLTAANAQTKTNGADIFTPISKYIRLGDCDKLSVWFADNLELDILGAVNNCSRNQAKLIMRNFFDTFNPKSFDIIHESGTVPMKYAVGKLDAGGDKFRIIISVKADGTKSYIQELKIERE